MTLHPFHLDNVYPFLVFKGILNLISAKPLDSLLHDPNLVQLAEKLQRIQQCCGEICETRPYMFRQGEKWMQPSPDKYFDFLEKQVSCKNLFECHRDIDESARSVKPRSQVQKIGYFVWFIFQKCTRNHFCYVFVR